MTVTARPTGPGVVSEPPRAEPDAALAGSPAMRRLCRDVVADPVAPRRVDVVGPAGHGKSLLLDTLAAAYRAAGEDVLRSLQDGDPDGGVLLLDDVHLLAAADVRRLRDLTADRRARIVLTHRPWPAGPDLAALGAALAVDGTLLVLGALDRPGVAARAARALRERPPVQLVDHVLVQTAGLPGLVDRYLAGVLDQVGRSGRAHV